MNIAKQSPWGLGLNTLHLTKLAAQCERATEFSRSPSSLFALAHAKVASIRSYNLSAASPATRQLQSFLPGITLSGLDSPLVPAIDETDLLLLDTRHTKARLLDELLKYSPSVRRFIVVHGTTTFGRVGEDRKPGLLTAVREFFASEAGKGWFTVAHHGPARGLTVLGRLPQDKPADLVPLWEPEYGPGTELMLILEALGLKGCDLCKARMRQMNVWGVEGCKKYRETIIGWLRDASQRTTWKEKVSATTIAIQTGLAFTLNPLDPFPGLVDEAIRRAEQKS